MTVERELDHLMYVWAVEMASVWDARGDLDGYCYWWSWRIEERWDETERVAYEAWKYRQLVAKGYVAGADLDVERRRRSGITAPVARVLLAHTAALTGMTWTTAPQAQDCTHLSGFFGGFSSCSACGISARRARQQKASQM